MKKQSTRLALNKETLTKLSSKDLRAVNGATTQICLTFALSCFKCGPKPTRTL